LGDQWNGEDLSIFSLDDRPLPLSPIPPTPSNGSTSSLIQKAGPNTKKEASDESVVNPGNLKASLKTPSISSKITDAPELTNAPGFRAAEAYVRPSPIATVGKVLHSGFDLRNCIFTFRLHAHEAGSEERPTEIFLPEYHFPKDKCEIEVSSGKWTISTDDQDGGMIQRLRWWHVEGEHSIKVTGVQRRQNMILGKEEEEGYLDQCQQSKCRLM
jgi:hypothetical protein